MARELVSVHLVKGPAAGRRILIEDITEVWVAMIDDTATVLPNIGGPETNDLLNRVERGGWLLYRRRPTERDYADFVATNARLLPGSVAPDRGDPDADHAGDHGEHAG